MMNSTLENIRIVETNNILNTITKENIEKTQESEIHYINTYYVDENKILDETNDKIIEFMSNELNDSYIKKEELKEIKNGNDLILIENNELKVSLTKSDNNIYEKKNESIINLGECENKLKEYYNISKNESLLILKIEVRKKEMTIPRLQYKVYYPLNENKLSILDLNKCNNINIIISNSIILDKKKVDIYNSSSNYYKDICYTYTTKNGTDIILKDRKEEYINNDLNACEEKCKFIEYNYENNKAICSCEIKKEFKKFSEININKTLLYQSITDIKNIMNLNVMKCYSVLFTKNGIIYNIGSYIILSIITFGLISIILFYLKDYILIKNIITNINKSNTKNKNNNKNATKKEANNQRGKKRPKKVKGKRFKNVKNGLSNKKIITKEEPSIKKIKKTKKTINNYSTKAFQTNIDNDISNSLINNSNIRKIVINQKHKIKNQFISEYNIYELNDLEYSEALKIDKRSYFEYYLSLLKTKHLFFFSFCKINDYNSRIIKLFLFFYSFIISFFVNTLFFNDSTMHKIYIDIGSYNFIYQLPQMLYSVLISSLLNLIIRELSLTEKKILNLKNKYKDIKNKKKELIKCLFYKFITFFIACFCLLLFFWYYISCFCAVYINTQTHLIKDTIISFGLSMIFPFGIYLLPGLFRIPALRDPKKEFMYNFSKIIQLF